MPEIHGKCTVEGLSALHSHVMKTISCLSLKYKLF